MSETNPEITPPKTHWWIYLALLIVLGLAVHLLLPQLASIGKSLAVLKKMTWWLVALATLAQIFSYVGSGYILKSILANRKQHLSIWKGVLITIASYSIGLVAGGWVGGAAATYGWMRKDHTSSDSATLASILPALLNDAALTVVSILGVIYLFIVHDLTKIQLLGYGLVLVILGALVILTVMATKRPQAVKRVAVQLGSRWAKLRHQDHHPEQTEVSVDRILNAWKSLDQGRWIKPTLGAFANVVFDMLTLYLVFLAAGYKMNISVLFAGYGLPLMLGKIAFILPGGVGVIEGSMAALFESLKVPSEVAVISILGYRVLSFWLPTLIGFIAAAFLGGKTARQKSPKDSPPVSR